MTSIMKKGAVGLIDQGMSSLSNVLAIVMVAQSLSASAFGSFTVSYAILLFVVTLARSYFGTQLGLTENGAGGPGTGARHVGRSVAEGNCFRIGLPMPRCWGFVDPRPRSWDPQPAMLRRGSRRRLSLALGQVGWS
jgi:hypothetical protein